MINFKQEELAREFFPRLNIIFPKSVSLMSQKVRQIQERYG
jgi:hypothetical protein